jgi:hypothetical protein
MKVNDIPEPKTDPEIFAAEYVKYILYMYMNKDLFVDCDKLNMIILLPRASFKTTLCNMLANVIDGCRWYYQYPDMQTRNNKNAVYFRFANDSAKRMQDLRGTGFRVFDDMQPSTNNKGQLYLSELGLDTILFDSSKMNIFVCTPNTVTKEDIHLFENHFMIL